MSISGLFEELDAPLNNIMWSWGGVRESDKAVFLRVWQDGTAKLPNMGNVYYTWVSDLSEEDQSLGARERRVHVDLIRNHGYKAYMIMCVDNGIGEERKISEFDHKDIRQGGQIVEFEGAYYIENVARIPVRQLKIGRK